jgi:hypothetical protein
MDQKMFGEGSQVLFLDLFHGFLYEHLHFDAHLFIIQLYNNISYCKKLSLYIRSKRILSSENMNVLLQKKIQVNLKDYYCYLLHVFKNCLHY